MNARLAFGGLLLLGFADLGLINFKLAPEYAEEQARLAMGTKPSGSTAPSASAAPAAVKPTAAAAPPKPEQTAAPIATAEPAPIATAEPVATAEPIATAEPVATAEPIATAEPVATAAPPVTVAQTATAAPPTPPPVADNKPAPSGDTPGPVEDIIFELDSVRLNAAAKTILEDVVRNLKANPSLKVHVRGHSDRMGSREHNLELSKKRAASVENFLHGSGISPSRITVEAMGGRKPVDPNNTPAGWARNRRVEIEWR